MCSQSSNSDNSNASLAKNSLETNICTPGLAVEKNPARTKWPDWMHLPLAYQVACQNEFQIKVGKIKTRMKSGH